MFGRQTDECPPSADVAVDYIHHMNYGQLRCCGGAERNRIKPLHPIGGLMWRTVGSGIPRIGTGTGAAKPPPALDLSILVCGDSLAEQQ